MGGSASALKMGPYGKLSTLQVANALVAPPSPDPGKASKHTNAWQDSYS